LFLPFYFPLLYLLLTPCFKKLKRVGKAIS
jgi:hypothetical protein